MSEHRNRIIAGILVIGFAFLFVWPVLAQNSGEIELVGSIEAMTSNTLTVNQQTVDISTSEINTPLELGAVVQVQGTLNADGSIAAREVNAVDTLLQPGEVELVGTIDSFSGTTLVVNGQTIDVTSAEVEAGLVVGQFVRVHASATGANTWKAREVQAVQTGDSPAQAEEFEITGTLEGIGNGTIVVSGQTINIANAQINDPLFIGALVRVHVSIVDGQLTAREVQSAAGFGDNLNGNANDNGNLNGNENTNANDNTTNANDNTDDNLNGNDNQNIVTAVTAQQAIQRTLEVYPNANIRSVRLETKFGGTLVWEVRAGGGLELNIDAQTGDILTIERGGNDNGNNNANGNDNNNGTGGDDNGNNNDNNDDNGNDNNGGDNNNNGNDNNGGGGNDNNDDNSGMGSDD